MPFCELKTGHIWLSPRFLATFRDFGRERDIVDTLCHASRPARLAATTILGILLHEGGMRRGTQVQQGQHFCEGIGGLSDCC